MRVRTGALAIVAAVSLARQAGACSMVHSTPLHLWPGLAMMLATPTSDTVFAGPGKEKPSLYPGHHGPVYDRPIYGQIMRVDSALGPGARSTSRVVLVPWDYDAGCNATPWGNSFVWRRPGASGLYSATLRDSAYWAGGLPTYDVFVTENQPLVERRGGTGSMLQIGDPAALTPEEFFSIARGFRVVTTERERHLADTAMFLWAEAHPALARRSPLDEGLSFAGYDRWRIRDVVLPTRGTYRVSYRIGADSITVFARTDAKPNDVWDGKTYLAPGSVETRLASDGYFVTGWNAADTLHWSPPQATTLDWSIAREPIVSNGRVTTWRGAIYTNMVPEALLTPELKKTIGEMNYGLEVRFSVVRDGSATFEHRSQLPDGRPIVVRGVRISPSVFPGDR